MKTWRKPKIRVIAVGTEINAYACAQLWWRGDGEAVCLIVPTTDFPAGSGETRLRCPLACFNKAAHQGPAW